MITLNYLNEIWKDVAGYQGLYQVSNYGRIRTLKYYGGNQVRIMVLKKQKNGYLSVTFCKGNKRVTKSVHRLVAEAFVANPNKLPCVNHKNEDKTDNRAENLEWCEYNYNCNYGTRGTRISAAHKETGHKPTEEALKMASEKNSKPVLQFSVDGEFIARYKSASEAAKANGLRKADICAVAGEKTYNGKKRMTYPKNKYKWKYE